jgi:hypothetical protein
MRRYDSVCEEHVMTNFVTIEVKDQGKIVVAPTSDAVELGIESPCVSCVAPVFRLGLADARLLRAALTEAILQLMANQAEKDDPIAKEAEE